MNVLLIPNVSYLFIVGGFLLAVLALFAPGTGVIEVTAIVALFIGGYGVISQPVNWWALAVLIVGVFPFILAVRKSGRLIYLFGSIAALVIGSTYLISSDVWWRPAIHPVLALLVSILAGGFMWIVGRKGLEAIAIKPQNKLEELIGAIGDTQTEVTLLGGSVYAAGESWSARSEKPIPANTRVQIIRREGFILEVKEIPQDSSEKIINETTSSSILS